MTEIADHNVVPSFVMAVRELLTDLRAVQSPFLCPVRATNVEQLLSHFCPSCSSPRRWNTDIHKGYLPQGVFRCKDCSCLYGETTEEASFDLVHSAWHRANPNRPMLSIPFDLIAVDAQGEKHRRHGFYDAETRNIVQAG